MRRSVAIAVLVACRSHDAPPPANKQAPATPACEQVPFAISSPVPEASGAAWLPIDGKLELVVVADSGNDGAYAILDPDSGDTLEQGKLPLDHGSDDLEGLAGRGDKLYGLSSAGWIRVWQRKDKGFELVDGPYALGPVTLPKRGGLGDKPPAGDGMVCPIEGTNCGRNYEGLCLAPASGAACAGFAEAKADGHLYCLTEKDGRFAVDHDRAIAVDRPGVVADCAFSAEGTLWTGNNFFGSSLVDRIDGWQDPAHAKVVEIGPFGIGFSEVIAVRGDLVYRMSDTGGAPSLMAKFRCSPVTR